MKQPTMLELVKAQNLAQKKGNLARVERLQKMIREVGKKDVNKLTG